MAEIFPSMKWRDFKAVLTRSPLNYEPKPGKGGSHTKYTSPTRPPLLLAFHDSETLPGGLIRQILTKRVGLAEKAARDLL